MMYGLYTVLTLAILILSCGTTQYDGPTAIHPSLRPLVSDWITTCKKHLPENRCDLRGIKSIRLESEMEKNVIGTCVIGTVYGEEVRHILIKESMDLESYTAKALMLHEMMHCRLGFEKHQNDGIMHEYVAYSEDTLREKWDELVQETYALVK